MVQVIDPLSLSLQYLLDSPGSDKPRLLTSEADQLYDEVVVCPEEQHPPPEVVAAPPFCLEAECR